MVIIITILSFIIIINHLGVGGLPSIILLCFSASSLLNSCDGVAKWPSCNEEYLYFASLYVLYSCTLDICIRCLRSKFLSGVKSFEIVLK